MKCLRLQAVAFICTLDAQISLMINQCKWEILELIETKEASFTGYHDVNVIYLFEEDERVWETKEDYVNFSILIFNKEGCINYFYEEKTLLVVFLFFSISDSRSTKIFNAFPINTSHISRKFEAKNVRLAKNRFSVAVLFNLYIKFLPFRGISILSSHKLSY